MTFTLEQATGQKMMLAFDGTEPTPEVLATLRSRHIGGFTLFRAQNLRSPEQMRSLTDRLQHAAREAGQPPLLIAVDQEGGTMHVIPGATRFPGNLALGATRSPDLAFRAGRAVATELAAVGANVNFAPVCDVNVNPLNPVIGPRAYGEDPALVAQLAAATIKGLQAGGIAATAKHFPGHGDTSTDSHFGVPVLGHTAERLRAVELPPFEAAVQAGVQLIMTGHIALPHFNNGADLPATLSPAVLQGLLRGVVGFQGVIISDALNMHAIQQGPGLVVDSIAAVNAGCDLLTLNVGRETQAAVYHALVQAAKRRLISAEAVLDSAARIARLKVWCAGAAPPRLDVVNCAEHRALADEIAARSITLVRDAHRQLPLRLPADGRIAVIVPKPQDLTPADTSSYERPALADAVRAFHERVDEYIVPLDPSSDDVSAMAARAADYDLVLVGTINATEHRGQAALVNALLAGGVTPIVVALRMPYDLSCFPAAAAYACTYSLQAPSLKALARALWGESEFAGVLPVSVPEAAHEYRA